MTEQDMPETVGELRRRLAEQGDPWTVDPRRSDEEPLPDYPRGGQPEEEIPEQARLRALDPGTDLRDVLLRRPPANPDLRSRWIEAGILDPDQVPPGPEPEQDEGGASG
jgi:hypothetical protein